VRKVLQPGTPGSATKATVAAKIRGFPPWFSVQQDRGELRPRIFIVASFVEKARLTASARRWFFSEEGNQAEWGASMRRSIAGIRAWKTGEWGCGTLGLFSQKQSRTAA
jgi:hypothetical protein